MPYETRLLERLGFEVFTPKIIPTDASFRSGAVDYACDARLTIPRDVLAQLNAFDFYSGAWPSDITFQVNRYFGSAFVMPLRECFREVLTRFEGQVLLRAFGLDNTMTYDKALRVIVGEQAFSWIQGAGERFWFAQGYEQLAECEPPLLARRAVYLPLGLPDEFWRSQGRWAGTHRHILFVCPNLVTNPYYSAIYKDFKKSFGQYPHVIVGAQDAPVDDPHVRGFVTADELDELYRTSAVLFYHSRERRHLHYSPIEAAIVGTPIVFYADSLLARLVGHRRQGAVDDVKQARALLEQLRAGEAATVQRLRDDQQTIGAHFSDEYCSQVWRAAFGAGGPLGAALRQPPPWAMLRREAARTLHYKRRLGAVATLEPAEPARADLTPPESEPQPGADRTEPPRPEPPYESLAWFDSIDLGDGRVTPGAAPRAVFLLRAQALLEAAEPSDALLDVGEGEGLYAFEAERRGLQDVSFLSVMNTDSFRYAKRALKSNVRQVSASLYQLETIHSAGFDCVVLRSVLNQVEAPLLLLQSAASVAKRVLVIEALLDLQDQARPLAVYYGAEQADGTPGVGWGFNRRFVEGALRRLGFESVRFEPTPDAPAHRGIFIAFKPRAPSSTEASR